MSTKTDPTETSAWVKELPQGGGAWGQGITGTIDQCAANIAQCDDEIAKHKAEITKIETVKKAQRKLQRDTAKRAEKEATTLFANSQIQSAKKVAEKKTTEATKAAAAQESAEGNAQASA